MGHAEARIEGALTGKREKDVLWLVPERFPSWLGRIRPDFAWEPDHALASVWIRGFQVARYLRKNGWMTACNMNGSQPRAAIFLRRYGARDVELARRMKASGTRIVLDVVTNYFSPRAGDSAGVGASSPEGVESFLRLVDLADQVWTVSPHLAELASKYHGAVHFVSDSVDPEHFRRNEHQPTKARGPLTVGWSGVSAKAAGLEEIGSILDDLVRENRARVLLISDHPPVVQFKYEFRRWQYAAFPTYISDCDLCVAPRRVADDYDRSHSVFKVGVFMSMGVPALAGPVPSYSLLLSDGEGGAVCNDEAEWRSHLESFLGDASLRRKWSEGAVTKMRQFTTPVIADQVAGLLGALL
jgi:glycosyltransferase involved in cell wall biosynthesis